MGALVDYLSITQKGQLPLLRRPAREAGSGQMQIDAATRRNLEITQSLAGSRQGSLLATIDLTVTAGGARLLERRIAGPSRDLNDLTSRHDAVGFFVDEGTLRDDLRAALRKTPDMDRALSRIALDRGGPRDMVAIRSGLTQAQVLFNRLSSFDVPERISKATQDLSGHKALIDLLDRAIVAEPPLLARDGGFIAENYDPDLDEARQLRDEGRSVIAGMQQQYSDETAISSLKIKHNNVLGYFIETTATHAEKMLSPPQSERYIHRQTTANAVRFTTVELSELETKILNAGQWAIGIETALFKALQAEIMASAADIGQTARALAELDLSAAFAELAVRDQWTRPILDDSTRFDITGGRHPVVEAALQKQSGAPFIANDCSLSEGEEQAHVWLLTGPNMAGKSTFLRQNALIALLAQSGAFVPAAEARLGIVSQLFSRVGASDDLARGRSTFMVEMVETAAILNQADDRSLVILDEIGRGTATYDGLSIAWATLEHLHAKNRCRALFATHYHELTALATKLDGVENATVAVKEWEGDVIFLHEVRKGAADRSYGVQVARLAGLPTSVVERARVVLESLESGDREGAARPKALVDDLPLFSATPAPTPAQVKTSELEGRMADIHPDELTPKEALDLIYELKAITKKS
jgi:DNA mismatch repair protein MutS